MAAFDPCAWCGARGHWTRDGAIQPQCIVHLRTRIEALEAAANPAVQNEAAEPELCNAPCPPTWNMRSRCARDAGHDGNHVYATTAGPGPSCNHSRTVFVRYMNANPGTAFADYHDWLMFQHCATCGLGMESKA